MTFTGWICRLPCQGSTLNYCNCCAKPNDTSSLPQLRFRVAAVARTAGDPRSGERSYTNTKSRRTARFSLESNFSTNLQCKLYTHVACKGYMKANEFAAMNLERFAKSKPVRAASRKRNVADPTKRLSSQPEESYPRATEFTRASSTLPLSNFSI